MQHNEMKPGLNEGIQSHPPVTPPHAKDAVDEAPAEEPAFASRAWWVQNGPILAIVGAMCYLLFGVLHVNFEFVLKVAVGLSLVIFIHELGHFLAAKWCDVHVTTFSIGFGPAIPGCSFQWGETTYKLGVVPLGG